MESIQIPITENGKTTLATAGKYCDRNIDVQVEVPSFEAELDAHKATEDELLAGTLTEYYNDHFTGILREQVLRSEKNLRIVKLPRGSANGTNCLYNCTSLEILEIEREVGHGSLKDCSALKALVIVGASRTNLWTTNSFENTGISAGTGFVYVPQNLVESYKAHTNWALFASQIFPFVNTCEELSNIDGTAYPRCWVRGQDKAYNYDGATWTEVAE